MKPNKKIGILGGVGSAATADFFSDVVKIAQEKYKAEQDTDFPDVYLYNKPLSGIDETGIVDPGVVKKELVESAKKLEDWGADFVVMPCNTVHYQENDVREALKIPFISIIQTAVEEAKKFDYKKVGVVSSSSTRKYKLYEDALNKNSVVPIIADDTEQKVLDEVILAVIGGKQGEKEKKEMLSIIDRMKNEGAEAIILGCTELPLAVSQRDTTLPLLNTIHILAESAVDEAYKK